MSTEELNYHDEQHRARTQRIAADMRHAAQRKVAEAEAKEATEEPTPTVAIPEQEPIAPAWSPGMAEAFHLGKQAELMAQLSLQRSQEEASRAARMEQVRKRQQVIMAERAAWEAEEISPERAQWYADFDAETEKQLALLTATHSDWSPEFIREEAQNIARGVMAKRKTAPPSLEAKIEDLAQRIAALEARMPRVGPEPVPYAQRRSENGQFGIEYVTVTE